MNFSVLRANARVYVVLLSFKWKPGELYVQYMSRLRGQSTCPTLHCIFAVGSDISTLRAPMAAAISPFMSPLSPPKP